QKLQERLNEINEGDHRIPADITFEQFNTEHWEPHIAGMKPSTRKSHQSNTRHHLLPGLGGLKLKNIQPPRLAKLLIEKRAAGMSQKSCLNLYLLLSAMFGYG